MQALKDQLRAAAAARDADIEAAVAPLKSELESKVQTTSRMESIVRSARNAAGKADAQAQVRIFSSITSAATLILLLAALPACSTQVSRAMQPRDWWSMQMQI